MERFKDLLTQEQKETLCYYHWEEGTDFEENYYLELMQNNDELKKVYFESLEECCRIYDIPYEKGKTICELTYEFDYNEFDELMLNFMATLNDKLGVGLYD